MSTAPKRGPGRPRGSGRNDDVVRFRVSAEEKALWGRVAERAGLTLSDWLRRVATRAAADYETSRP